MFLASQQIVLASGNVGKIKEIQAMLAPHIIVPQAVFKVSECDEIACTFVENALLKARNAARHCHLPVIADDSGLIVDVLQGAPGVKSARYAGIGASDLDNVNKLLETLAGIPDTQRTARFVCIMVFIEHADDPCPLIAQGMWEGSLLNHAVGGNGFGYDPIFWLADQQCTSAELSADAKNELSHRGQALRQLTAQIKARESV